MEKYRGQYPDADILLFEPDREDADMFFANIFSYRQRKRLCAMAFAKTRQNIAARARELAPILRKHGISIRHDRLAEADRNIGMAMTDPRPLRADAANQTVRQTTRELRHTLDQLERAVVVRALTTPVRRLSRAPSRPASDCPPWRNASPRAGRASASSKRAWRSSTAWASRTSRRPTSPTR